MTNFLWQICKGIEKFVLAKFCSNVDKKICRLISNENGKAKGKFNVVTGQTKFRLVRWNFFFVLWNFFLKKTTRAAVLGYFAKWCS